jgi:hypothetical protein
MAEPLTAAQRAMSTAEIIGLVITNMSRYGDAWAHDLLSCALVNKKWMMDSLAMMWKSLHNDHRFWSATYDTNPPGLDVIFFEMRPDRRQFYANFVCCATINPLHEDYYGEDPWAKGDELEGIFFPKMTVLHVMLKAGSGKSVSGSDRSVMDPILPSLNCPKLHTMDFSCNGPKVTNRVSPDTWESVFWDLPVSYTLCLCGYHD